VKYIKKIILVYVVFGVLYACSAKKDTFISRNYHALTTKFNVLFNGKEAFNLGINGINEGYKDDYFKQLPIEPIEFEEERITTPNFANFGMGSGFNDTKKEEKKQGTPFELAEEKAVKAIQKHGMNIEGQERNSQIDDAYLLLGKSRYYSQRFIPAIEAFNYIIANYPGANLISETKIWRAKTNIRLDNEEFAIESMKLLLQVKDTFEVDLPDTIKEQGHTALAMAYVKADSLQKVKKHLHLATRTLENREQGARNLFILGQIYASENKKDSAIMVFNTLKNFKKAPYKFKIHSSIEIAKNSVKDSSTVALIDEMQKLIMNRDNRPYLDELYYQVGFLHEKNDSIQSAIKYYNKSITAKNGSNKQKTFTYEKLGNLYFKKSEYQLAGAYYDSVLNVSKDSLDLRIRRIKRKYKNLVSLIKFENVITENDSIIKIASLSKNEQELFFQKYIDNLKKEDEETAQLRLNQAAFGSSFGGNSLQSNKQGKWYFYNNQSLGFGKTEFQKTWGNRKLEDNWRWSAKISTNTSVKDSLQVKTKNLRYDLASYIKTIPTKKETLDSLKTDRNQALYELGLIYKEQFKNPNLAIKRLQRVEFLNPKKNLILPINWHLYQLYKGLGSESETNKYKEKILIKYPNTVFAKIIKSPNKKITEEVTLDEVENKYKEVYYLYKEDKFEETVKQIVEILPTIQNSKLISKFELLRAYAIGKYADKETYKLALEFVTINYSNTVEGKKAHEIVKQLSK
jgi:tetratricopeptide (TPR) repeat protein